ncbi:hypothetical protein ACFLZC_02730 [Patescibacteria group bacterium]
MKKIDGVWNFEDSLFLAYVWGFNFNYFLMMLKEEIPFFKYMQLFTKRYYPTRRNNGCPILWGSLFGIVYSLLIGLLTLIVNIIILVMIAAGIVLGLLIHIGIVSIGGFFGLYAKPGFIPDLEEGFYPYKHFGKKQTRIPIALWEISTVVLAIWLIVTKYDLIVDFAVRLANYAVSIATSNFALSFFVGLVLLFGICYFFFFSKTWSFIWDLIKAGYHRFCPVAIISFGSKFKDYTPKEEDPVPSVS